MFSWNLIEWKIVSDQPEDIYTWWDSSEDYVIKKAQKLIDLSKNTAVDISPEKLYWLTLEGKDIITTVRTEHVAPSLIPESRTMEGLCAWYLYELTAKIRWVTVPYRIGMMNPQTKKAASARELPYSYRRYGWVIPIEIPTEQWALLKKNQTLYPDLVSDARIKNFFISAFSPQSLLGDLGFLYYQTSVSHKLWTYDNYNSHIGKNFWFSSFNFSVETEENRTAQIIKDTLNCEDKMWLHVRPLLKHYTWTINNSPVELIEQWSELLFINTDTTQEILLQLWDIIGYEDITVVDFFEWSRVSSLLQLTCWWEFYPINIMQINSKFLETM